MISKLTRLPIVLANVPPYKPSFAEIGPDFDLIYDEIVYLRHASSCSACGYGIPAGNIARSRAELRRGGLHRFKWCEACDLDAISQHLDGRAVEAAQFDIDTALAAAAVIAENPTKEDTLTDQEWCDSMLDTSRAIGRMMDEAVLAFATDDTLLRRSLNIRKTLARKMTAFVNRDDGKAPESAEEYMQERGILVPTDNGTSTNLDSVAEELEVDDETARVLACYPQALKAIITAFWRLKRAA